jgi:hypothetical protein
MLCDRERSSRFYRSVSFLSPGELPPSAPLRLDPELPLREVAPALAGRTTLAGADPL